MLSLQHKLSLSQKLSPQQIQYQKLLQLNTLALEQRIKTELELNPILEETLDEEYDLDQEKDDDNDDAASTDDEDEKYDSKEDEFELEDFMNETESEHEFDRLNRSHDEEKMHPVTPQRSSMRENLVNQLHMLDITEEEMILGENIIGGLDKDGYFKTELEKIVNELKMFENIEVSLEQAEKILKQIQLLEPVGIGTRNLQECLLVQIRNSSYDPYYSYLAEKILAEHFDDFANRRFDTIQKEMNLAKETLRTTIDVIQKLNPKPGEGNIDSEEMNQITPDFLIEKVEDNYIVTLNDRSVPSVTISRTYLEMIDTKKHKRKISDREKETYKFLREKFESAKWFIASLQQRRNTLMKIMRSILERQYEFFENGPRFLKPMIYKDIAEEIQMDISTISRVVNGKFVQSPQGIHELKYFFSEGLSTDSGDEISNKHIKELIKEICDNEPKDNPYSDDKIAIILQERGIHVARRTIAKYREALKIPVARLRKEL
ncbi:MAG: RNA polymerase sigma-54 factor [Ignavibacteriae bacterium HGW-Ignavibacteriae-3]|nr:MAG: RNA polymerase sigma-54 factor [Ignavibacteriae bacterium HGW-Ignavibacteriae-3]